MLNILIPCCIINAQDDPFLAGPCYPKKGQIQNPNIHTIYPKHGGHLGFNRPLNKQRTWLDQQALNFLLG